MDDINTDYKKSETINKFLQPFRKKNIHFEEMQRIYGERYSKYRRAWNSDSLVFPDLKFPLNIDVEIKDNCNLSCITCEKNHRSKLSISTEIIDRLIENIKKHNLESINITSTREPLLDKPQLFYLLDELAKTDVMDVFMHTNAILMDDESIEKLLASPLKHLCISVDAATPESYKTIRKSSIEVVEKNIKKFMEARKRKGQIFPEVRLSFCVTPINAHERELFLDKWLDIVDLVEFQDYIDYGGIDVSNSGELVARGTRCVAPAFRFLIWPNGNIYACCINLDTPAIMGNILEDDLADIWNSKKYVDFRKNLFNGNLETACMSCLQCLGRNVWRPTE